MLESENFEKSGWLVGIFWWCGGSEKNACKLPPSPPEGLGLHCIHHQHHLHKTHPDLCVKQRDEEKRER